MISRIIITFGLCFSLIILSCEGDKLLNTSKQISKMEISVSGLNVPGDSTWYEAWLFPKDGSSVDTILSLGRLSLSDGQYVTSMNVNSGYLQGAERIILSMEREDIPSQSYDINGNTGTKGPNQFWILSAELAANEATLNVGTINNFDFSLEGEVRPLNLEFLASRTVLRRIVRSLKWYSVHSSTSSFDNQNPGQGEVLKHLDRLLAEKVLIRNVSSLFSSVYFSCICFLDLSLLFLQ